MSKQEVTVTVRGKKGASDPDDDEAFSHPMTPDQMVVRFIGQLMTQNDRLQKRLVDVLDATNQRLQSQAEHIERLEDARRKSLELEEEMLSRRHERELEAEEAKTKRELMENLINDVRPLTTLLAKKWAGVPLGEEGELRGVADLVSTLTTKQMSDIAKTLQPGQMALLQELVEHGKLLKEKGDSDEVH